MGPVAGTTGAGAGTATGAGAWPKGAISGTGTTGAGACTGTGGAFGSSAPTEFGSAAFAAATASEVAAAAELQAAVKTLLPSASEAGPSGVVKAEQ